MEVAMPEDQASKIRRQRHFWRWVTRTKKLPKNEVSRDFKRLNNLRSQHAELFPQYYEALKSFSVKEGIKKFHRRTFALQLCFDRRAKMSFRRVSWKRKRSPSVLASVERKRNLRIEFIFTKKIWRTKSLCWHKRESKLL